MWEITNHSLGNFLEYQFKGNFTSFSFQNPTSRTSLNNNIHSQQTKPLLEDVKGMDMHPNQWHTSSPKELLKTADIKINKIK